MQSFTPFSNPTSPFLDTNILSWMSLSNLSSNLYLMMSLKNLLLSQEKTTCQPIIEQKLQSVSEKT